MSRHNPTFGRGQSRPFGIAPDHEPVAVVLDLVIQLAPDGGGLSAGEAGRA